ALGPLEKAQAAWEAVRHRARHNRARAPAGLPDPRGADPLLRAFEGRGQEADVAGRGAGAGHALAAAACFRPGLVRGPARHRVPPAEAGVAGAPSSPARGDRQAGLSRPPWGPTMGAGARTCTYQESGMRA